MPRYKNSDGEISLFTDEEEMAFMRAAEWQFITNIPTKLGIIHAEKQIRSDKREILFYYIGCLCFSFSEVSGTICQKADSYIA